jgi:hypothetical protein
MGAGERVNDMVDWENVAEEIETLGRSERSRLACHICIVLEHLMRLEAAGNRSTARLARDGRPADRHREGAGGKSEPQAHRRGCGRR